MTTTSQFLRRLLPPLLTLCVLGGIVAGARANRSLASAALAYHARVRQAADAAPFRIGTWFAEDTPVPQAAVAMLHPNVIVSRRYREIQSGQSVSFLLVQCSDARDILGHYPPVCYVAHGWTHRASSVRNCQIDDLSIETMEYDFTQAKLEQESRLIIENLMILPDGTICRDMDGVDRIARDRRLRYFGAAQMQLVCPADMPATQREDLLREFVRGYRTIIDAIRRGEAE